MSLVENFGPVSTEQSEPLQTVIAPASAWAPLNLRAIWDYRELLYFLAWRDIKVRYKQTALGVMWVVLQPLLMMVIYTVFFGHLAKIPSGGVPYPLFVFSGLLSWQLFANAVTDCGNSLVANQNLITKVYFPRLIIPIAAIVPRLVDFLCAFFVFLGMMVYFGISPSINLWMLPFFVLLTLAATIGVSLWLSALNVRYRDVRHMLPFLIQVWFFLSPVVYPSSLVPEAWKGLYALNPMVAVVEGFRWSILGAGEASTPILGISGGVLLFLLVSGLYYFRRMERTFADVV